ncbi:MAG: pilus assembly protein [Acidobacteria bacterium]|nr:pilus assembly protein [Acidobacteriota bacterium]
MQIEFVLSFLTIMFVIFGIWELIMVVYTMNVLSDAAKEGVRYAIVHGGGNINCSGPNPSVTCTNPDPAADNVVALVKDWAQYSFHDIAALNVTVSYPDSTSEAPGRVRVEVVYDFIPFTALPIRPALSAVAEGRIVN